MAGPSSTPRPITVGDFMTRELVTLSEGDDIALADGMLKLGGIRHLPVVRDGALVGLLTHRDLLRATSADRRVTTVGEVMVRDLVTARAETPLVVAARAMLERKFGCLPVTDPSGRLVGIVTESDFVRFAADMIQDLDIMAEAAAAAHRA
jgi:CBS domain-containing protein